MDSTAVQDIKARLNVVDVVGGYVRLTKSGTHWKACCPFHNEKSPSFMVNEERQIFHCFGCGKGGDMFSFIEEIEGVDFREALRLLAEKAGVELPKYRKESVFAPGGVEEPDRTKEILELSTRFFETQLWSGEGTKSAFPYLRDRGLSDESIRTFRLGYAPEGWRHLLDFLVSRGYREEELERAGLVIKKEGGGYYDRFRDRIMFPIGDVVGRIIGYSARVAPGGDESQAKYINTPETSVYHKSRALYGIYQAKQAMKEKGFSVLVEGNMDVIACHQADIRNTVAVSGTALTVEQLDILKRYGNGIRLFFDMDGAGQAASWKSSLLALEKEMEVSIIALPHGKDAADAAKEDPESLREAATHAVPVAQYFLDKLRAANDAKTPAGKRRIAEGFAPLLASMRNRIEHAYWRKELAEVLGVEEKVLSDVLLHNEILERREIIPTGNEEEPAHNSFAFVTRSGVLRDRIVGLLLLDGSIMGREPMDESIRAFLLQDSFFETCEKNGGNDAFSHIEGEAQKRRAALLMFEAEKLFYGNETDSDFDRNERKMKVFRELVRDLAIELRRQDRADIARALEEARKSGDKSRERELMEQFREISREN